MKAVRRWFIYRRLVNELSDAPGGSLTELGTCRAAINEFAWCCAHVEVERDASTTRHRREAKRPALRGDQTQAADRR
jgi:hypothetical protein